MARLQLYVRGQCIADWELVQPSYEHSDFTTRVENRKIWLDSKVTNLVTNHIMAILKYPDYVEVAYTVASSMREDVEWPGMGK